MAQNFNHPLFSLPITMARQSVSHWSHLLPPMLYVVFAEQLYYLLLGRFLLLCVCVCMQVCASVFECVWVDSTGQVLAVSCAGCVCNLWTRRPSFDCCCCRCRCRCRCRFFSTLYYIVIKLFIFCCCFAFFNYMHNIKKLWIKNFFLWQANEVVANVPTLFNPNFLSFNQKIYILIIIDCWIPSVYLFISFRR